MKFGRIPTKPLRSLLGRRATSYTIYEEDGGDDGDWNNTSTLVSLTTAQLDVYGYQSSPESYPTGDVTEANLRGLMDTREKTDAIENGVCIVHGGQVFEMQLDPWPDADSPAVYVLALNERTDLTPP